MASIIFGCHGFHVKRNTFILNAAAFTELHKEVVIIAFDSPFPYRSRSLSKQDLRSVTCESSKIQDTQAEQLQGAACCPKKIHL